MFALVKADMVKRAGKREAILCNCDGRGGGSINPWVLLACAIAGKVIATTSRRFSQGFTRPVPVVFVRGFAIWLQSLVLKQLPLGTVYAVWVGVGTAITALLGIWLFRESLTPAVAIGILLIIGGVIVRNTAMIAR